MGYIQYCKSDRERSVMSMTDAGMSTGEIADSIEVHIRTVSKIRQRVRQRAEVQGYSPEDNMHFPEKNESFLVKGTSTLVDADGNVKLQWIKTNLKQRAAYEVAKGMVDALVEDIDGKFVMVVPPTNVREDLCNVIPIGDAHFGMYANKDEVGEDFNMQKNLDRHLAAVRYLVDKSEPAKEGIIINVGDYLHCHDHGGTTPRSGNKMDMDGRWPEVVREATKAFIQMITMMLEKNENVTVLSVAGNHDPSSWMMTLILEAYFRNEPRIRVETSANKFYYHQFGKNMFMVTHSDTIKPADAPSIMATDEPKMWGDTVYRFAHLGHQHHIDRKEHRGAVVEIHRTLAGSDAWHHASGYRSMEECKLITYHREYGEIQRINVNPAIIGV